MSNLSLVPDDHALLKAPLARYVFPEDPRETIDLVNSLAETMFKHNGIGLSANQVGFPHRIFVVRTHPEVTAFINAKIVDESTDLVLMEEGCLSYPGLHVKIKRPAHIKVRFTDAYGQTHTEKFTGLTARVIQHELDHMDGLNFLNRAGPLAKESAMKKWKKLKKQVNLKRKLGYYGN